MMCSRCLSTRITYQRLRGITFACCQECGSGQAIGVTERGETVTMIHDPLEGIDRLEIGSRRFVRHLPGVARR